MARDLAEQYLSTNCTYDFWLRPADVPDLAAAEKRGINCVVLAHLFIKDYFGVELPKDLRCTELFLNDTYLSHEPYHAGTVTPGDLVWFGRHTKTDRSFAPMYDDDGNLTNWAEAPVSHVGIAGRQPIWRARYLARHTWRKHHGLAHQQIPRSSALPTHQKYE